VLQQADTLQSEEVIARLPEHLFEALAIHYKAPPSYLYPTRTTLRTQIAVLLIALKGDERNAFRKYMQRRELPLV